MMGSSRFEVVQAKSGLPALRVSTDKIRYLHSSYDPLYEASALVESWNLAGTDSVVIYGLGLAYHVDACLQAFPDLRRVYVIETYSEVIDLARKTVPHLLEDKRIAVMPAFTEEQLLQVLGRFELKDLLFHPPSLEICPFQQLKALFQEARLLQQTVKHGAKVLDANWTVNRTEITDARVLNGERDLFSRRPGFIVAAGPSLDASLGVLRTMAQTDAVILSVSAVLRRLLESNIRPTYAVMTDGGRIVLDHLHNLSTETELPPLYVLPTVHPEVPRIYPGEVRWVLQSAYSPVRAYADEHQLDVFETGGSVATLALSMLYYWGCNPIVFVGQDLAFLNGRPYGTDTNHDFMVPEGTDYRRLLTSSVCGAQVKTTTTWNSFRRWIERFISAHPDRTYVNTSQGAHILGTTHEPIEKIYHYLGFDH